MNTSHQPSHPETNKWMVSSVVLALLCASMLFYVITQNISNKKDEIKIERPMVVVTTITPKQRTITNKVNANGYIQGWQDAAIGAESQGQRITDVRVNVGDWVNKGQILATYDTGLANANVAQIDANLREAELSAKEAQNLAERARSLEKTGAMSNMMINQYITTAETSKARVASLQASKSSAHVQARQTTIVAPDAGIISVRNANIGLVTGPGVELFRLIRQGKLEWQAELNSADVGKIKEGMDVLVKSASGKEITGKVRTIAPTLNPKTNMIVVYVTMPVEQTKHSDLMEGMYAEGSFIIGEGNTMILPTAAVVLRDGLSYVFIINKQTSRVKQVPITVGRRFDDQVEVLDGITLNQWIVNEGAGFLNEGDLVQIGDANITPSPTATSSATTITNTATK